MIIIKATYFEDEKFYKFELPQGHYFVNGEPVSVSVKQEFTTNEKPVICSISRTAILTRYENRDGDILLPEEHEKRLIELRSKGEWNESTEVYEFENIEDSFDLQRFQKSWVPIYKQIQTQSDPFQVEVKASIFNTGNPYISNVYNIDGGSPHVFMYNRNAALRAIASKVMRELGMVFEDGIDYSKTKNKKIWGCRHQGIRFLVAFGTYPFSDEYESKCNPRDTLEAVKGMYERDLKNVTRIIKTHYTLHFNSVANIKLEELLANLRCIQQLAREVESRVKTQRNYQKLNAKINSVIVEVGNQLAAQAQEA